MDMKTQVFQGGKTPSKINPGKEEYLSLRQFRLPWMDSTIP